MSKKSFEGQMQAYVHWVNAQLKKRPGSRVVDNLEHDMRDGVAFLQLIEVIGDENVSMIESPANLSEMTLNVTRVLKFMAERKIKMHQINKKEIVEGNLKAIMRLILALAAHFKPGSVRPTNSNDNAHGKLERASSTMSLAAEAAAALADASQMASSAGLSLHYKYRNRPNFDMQPSTSDASPNILPLASVHSRSSSSASNASHHSAGFKPPPHGGTLPRTKPRKKYGDLTPTEMRSRKTSMDVDRTQVDQRSLGNPKSEKFACRKFSEDIHRNRVSRKLLLSACKSDGGCQSRNSSRPCSANSTNSIDDHILAEEHDNMVLDVKVLKDYLLDLQQLLLEGEEAEKDGNNNSKKLTHALSLDGAPFEEQVVVYKARLDQANKDYQSLQNNHSSLKEEIIKLQGEKVGLQDRLTQIEQAHIDLRSDQLRQELACDSARSAKESAQRIIDERERQITSLHEEVARKDQMIHNQNREIEQLLATLAGRENTEADRDRELARQDFLDKDLRLQIEEITGRLEGLSDSENHMNSQIDHYNNRLAKYEQAITRSLQFGDTREEYEKASITLKNLRSSFGKHDPRQHSLDGVEQSLNIILQKAAMDEEALKSLALSKNSSRRSSGRISRREKLGELESIVHHKPNGIIERATLNKPSKRTKVLYFRNQSITPYLGFINKELGEITLLDFKSMLDRPGDFRYFFKSVDPDFGSVREEIVSDDEIVPGWDDKIVSWIEEDKETKTPYENHNHKTSHHVRHANGTQEDFV